MQIAKHGDCRDQQRDKIGFVDCLSSAAGQVRRSRTPEPQERANQGNPYQGNSRPLLTIREEAEVMRSASMENSFHSRALLSRRRFLRTRL
jgi:hypothetical protein